MKRGKLLGCFSTFVNVPSVESEHCEINHNRSFMTEVRWASEKQKLGDLLTLLTEAGFRFVISSRPRRSPFLDREVRPEDGMDLRLNIFASHKRCTMSGTEDCVP